MHRTTLLLAVVLLMLSGSLWIDRGGGAVLVYGQLQETTCEGKEVLSIAWSSYNISSMLSNISISIAREYATAVEHVENVGEQLFPDWQGNLIIFGGRDVEGARNDTLYFNPRGPLSSLPPPPSSLSTSPRFA
mmetsp:Transcript_18597/g.61087  ORF Transcript_18597/g.61087 Transcript_18597/m.61087 type:complete len:133 (-) Transcript_18597:5132-5530(-)